MTAIFNSPGVRLGHDDLDPKVIAKRRLAAAIYSFKGISYALDFDKNMRQLATECYELRMRRLQAAAVVATLGLLLGLLWFFVTPASTNGSISLADMFFLLAGLAVFIFRKEPVDWLWPVPSMPTEQWLTNYIRKEGPRMVALFDTSATKFNEALQELKSLVPDAKNVDRELCLALHLACGRIKYATYFDLDLSGYLDALLAIGEANSRPDAKIKRFVCD